MKLTQLQYICAVAETGSFSAGARMIGVAQPALSQQIRMLEEELQTSLFLRSQSGVEPTQSGLILIDHAQRIIEQIELARHDTLTNGNEPIGEVSLIMANAVSAAVLPHLVAKLASRYPKITLKVRSDTSPQVQLALQNARYDLGILPQRSTLTKVNTAPFIDQHLYFISKPSITREAKEKRSLSLEQCALHKLVLVRTGQPFRQQLERSAEQQGLKFDVKYETNSLQMISSYVESGLACSILPWCAVEEKVLLGKVQARLISRPTLTQSYLVAWPKLRPLNFPGNSVKDTLVESVAALLRSSPIHTANQSTT